jgi:hypothetical protein
MNIFLYFILGVFALIAALVLIALPAMFTLPSGRRPGTSDLQIEAAAEMLIKSGKTGWDLVNAAVRFVHDRMQYCRRNSFDSYRKAFWRGYGYCQQQAFALQKLLSLLGFKSEVVYAFLVRLHSGKRANHAWVRVTYEGETRDICPIFTDENDALTFTPPTKIRHYTPFFRVFAGWGSAAVNAVYYYRKGRDL